MSEYVIGGINMGKMRKHFLISLVLLTLVMWLIGWAFFLLFPQFSFTGYPALPPFFYALGMFDILILEAYYCRFSDTSVAVYLAMKVVRLFLSSIYVLLYFMLTSAGIIPFLITFTIFHVVYLIYETRFYVLLEQGKGKNTKKEK